AVLGLDLVEGGLGGVPVGHVADRGDELVAVRLLLPEPLVEVAAGPAARNDEVACVMQATADGRPDATHPACHVRHFLAHFALPLKSRGGHLSSTTSRGLRAARLTIPQPARSLTHRPGASSIGRYFAEPGCFGAGTV